MAFHEIWVQTPFLALIMTRALRAWALEGPANALRFSILCVSARSGAPERHFESRKRRLNPKFMKCHQIPRTSSRLSSATNVTGATPVRPCERKHNSTSRTTCPIQTLQRDLEHNAIENKKPYIIMGARWRQSHLHRYYSSAVQNLLYELLLFRLKLGGCYVNIVRQCTLRGSGTSF